ncbi:unnamed protein product [Musa acuminata subsp. malaccensis]|uniref:(wild Malaysian banana) hypothetical protein n=1 Tax=Musa acuminata subsp. malaccensis TaxID=214687 RepID=A0A8D6ZZY1_MUSAM|nr:unnamed protein product [Musa acuminata subsp. malaccensis]
MTCHDVSHAWTTLCPKRAIIPTRCALTSLALRQRLQRRTTTEARPYPAAVWFFTQRQQQCQTPSEVQGRGYFFSALRKNFPPNATSRSDHRDRPPQRSQGTPYKIPAHSDPNQAVLAPRSRHKVVYYRFQLPSPPLDGSPNSTLVVSDLEKLSVVGHGGGGTVYKVRCRHTSSPSRSSASIGTPSTPGSRRLARSIF